MKREEDVIRISRYSDLKYTPEEQAIVDNWTKEINKDLNDEGVSAKAYGRVDCRMSEEGIPLYRVREPYWSPKWKEENPTIKVEHNPAFDNSSEGKYFTPSIEDIRVGYECENLVEVQQTNFKVKEWRKIKIWQNILKYTFSWVDLGIIRTPYLTKEQIENEEGICPLEYEGSYKLRNHWLRYNFNTRILSIIPIDPVKEENYWHEVRFIGVIPSINEFRYIVKLLGI